MKKSVTLYQSVEDVERTVATRVDPDAYDLDTYHNGHPFYRLTLTLSGRGWTSSIEWRGMCGTRGSGRTQIEAINNSIDAAEKYWDVVVSFKSS